MDAEAKVGGMSWTELKRASKNRECAGGAWWRPYVPSGIKMIKSSQFVTRF
jgi:hypothetical protein